MMATPSEKKSKKIPIIISPYGIVILTTLVSFILWCLPDFSGNLRKGFDNYFSPTSSGIIICFLWLLTIIFCSYFSFMIGSKLKLTSERLNIYANVESYEVFKLLIFLGIVGVVYVLAGIVSALGINGILRAVSGGEANALKDTLYSDYKIGLASFRYMSIPAAALGFYHLLNRRYIFMSFISIISLLVVTLISSRLSLVYTVFIFISLIYLNGKLKVNRTQIIIGFLILFHLLCFLNYTRNINFYRSIGINNFYMAGISEIVTYVGSPFQGFLASGTYGDILSNKTEEETHIYTGVSIELSTNSAFLELLRRYSLIQAFLIISISATLGAFLMAVALKNRYNILGLLFGVVGYCFAETWRVFLFGQGIVYTIIILIFSMAIFLTLFPRIRWKNK